MAALASIAIVTAAVGLSVSHGPSAPDLEPAAGPIGGSIMEKPSIAVLRFENLTGDPEQNLLAESISDGIFEALSRFSDLYVVTTRRIEDPGMETAEIAERNATDLGVRYLLRVALRGTANRVHITTQLFDTNGHRYAWGGRYDASLKDVFSAENGVFDTIATGVWAELNQDIDTAAWRNEAESAEAYRLAVVGLEHYRRFTPADNIEAKSYFRTAVTLDPEFLSAWAALGWSYFNEARYGWGDNPEQSLSRAAGVAAKVLAIDANHLEARALETAIARSREQVRGSKDEVIY
jgi:adenylate cyclase